MRTVTRYMAMTCLDKLTLGDPLWAAPLNLPEGIVGFIPVYEDKALAANKHPGAVIKSIEITWHDED